jgi:hypothetical protein
MPTSYRPLPVEENENERSEAGHVSPEHRARRQSPGFVLLDTHTDAEGDIPALGEALSPTDDASMPCVAKNWVQRT